MSDASDTADLSVDPGQAGSTAASRPRRGLAASRATFRGLVLPVLILVLWEAAARAGLVAANLLPAPSAVLDAIAGLAATGELFDHIQVTLSRVFFGFLAGSAAATVLGGLTGYSRAWRELLDPLLQALRNIPSIAWVPLFILWFGIFETSKVTLIAVGVFFPVYLNLMSGIQDVDRKLVEVGRMYRMSGLKLVRRVLLPATLPAYVVGLRGGLGLGWMFVVAAEYMGASKGLGFLMIDGQMTGRPQIIIAALVLFAVFGKATDMVLAAIGRHFLAWQDSFGSQKASPRQERR